MSPSYDARGACLKFLSEMRHLRVGNVSRFDAAKRAEEEP
jgi:hypothetical protein